MKKLSLALVAFAAALSLTAPVAADSLSTRDFLRALTPAALEVLRDIEQEAGRRFLDDELQSVFGSEMFQQRLRERVKGNPDYSPCRIEHCVLA